MRVIFIFISLLFTVSFVFGQDDLNRKKIIGFGCYFAGQPTRTVEEVTKLLLTKKYESVSTLLKSGHAGEKFLAIVALEKLAALGKYKLSDDDKELINRIKNSGDKVSVCSGCTYFDKVSLKRIFSQDNFLGSTWWIDDIVYQK